MMSRISTNEQSLDDSHVWSSTEKKFNGLDQNKNGKQKSFGRGHIIRQYMSGVGVITERYIPDNEILFYESTERSSNYSTTSDDKSHVSSSEDEEDTTNNFEPMNCPCYEKSLSVERKKIGMFRKIFPSIFKFLHKKKKKINTK